MTLLNKFILLAILATFGVKTTYAQGNILDCDNSRRFANYLYNTRQYELAMHELERINFFCEPDSGTQLILLKSYRKLKNFSPANNFFSDKSDIQLQALTPGFREEYIRLLMTQKQYSEVKLAIENGLTFREKQEHLLGLELLEGNFQNAYALSKEATSSSAKMNALVNISVRSHETPRKKPWLATIMSAVIPGSGKMYSGYWGDGLISLLFTASSSFFTYRAFNKYGTNKVYPWIAGGLSVSYYAGNIYGGHKAAVRYNNNIEHGFIHQTEQILFTGY